MRHSVPPRGVYEQRVIPEIFRSLDDVSPWLTDP
jgi:hypothetical protein